MKSILYSLFGIMFFTFVNTSAQEFKFSGWGATGYTFIDKQRNIEYNQEVYYEAKLQADIKLNKKIEAQIDFRGNSQDNNVRFREFSVKFKLSDYIKLKVGNIKRPFGYEYAKQKRETIQTIERSIATDRISELGYGGRSVSLMAYYNYSNKRNDFPYSYNMSLFSNNSQNYGVGGRFGYHFNASAVAINLMYQAFGGEVKFTSVGIGADYTLKQNKWKSVVQVFYVQDPVEGIIRQLQKEDDQVFSTGATFSVSKKFNTDAETIIAIEPVILAGFFSEDTDELKDHVIQTVIGANFYIHKNAMLRFNGDIRLTKNGFNSEYVTKDSRAVLEVLVRI